MCRGKTMPGKSTTFKGNRGISIDFIDMIFLLWQKTTSTGSRDSQDISSFYIDCYLAGQFPYRPRVFERIAARRACCSTVQPIRRSSAAVGQQRHGGGDKELDFTAQSFAAMKATGPTGTPTQGVAAHAQGQFHLQRFNGRVAGVAHMDMHARQPVRSRSRAHATAHCFIVGKYLIALSVIAAKREVIHRSLRGRRYLLRRKLR